MELAVCTERKREKERGRENERQVVGSQVRPECLAEGVNGRKYPPHLPAGG